MKQNLYVFVRINTFKMITPWNNFLSIRIVFRTETNPTITKMLYFEEAFMLNFRYTVYAFWLFWYTTNDSKNKLK